MLLIILLCSFLLDLHIFLLLCFSLNNFTVSSQLMHFSEKHHNCFSFTCRFNKIPSCYKYNPPLHHFPGCPYSSQRRAQRRSLRRNIFVTFAKSNAKALLTPPASKMQTRRRVLRPAGGFFCLRQAVMSSLYSFCTACYTVPPQFLYCLCTVPVSLPITNL